MKSYFERNQRWLKPTFGGLMIAMGAIIVLVMGGQNADTVPAWLPAVGLVVAGFGAGLGAMFTDTTSAYIVRFVGTAAGFAVILNAIFR